MMKYTVMRQHFGDKLYMPGDEREAREADVSHLVSQGVLSAPETKKAAPLENKKASAKK